MIIPKLTDVVQQRRLGEERHTFDGLLGRGTDAPSAGPAVLGEALARAAADPHALPEWSAWDGTPDGWYRLPPCTKDDIAQRFPIPSVMPEGLHGNSTGGSTGQPLRFLLDAESDRLRWAAQQTAWRLAGWRPGLRTLAVWGSQRDIGEIATLKDRVRRAVRQQAFGTVLLDGFAVDDARLDDIIERIRRGAPVAFYGYTSLMQRLAQRVLQRNLSMHGLITAAWNGGEVLLPEQSDLFRDAFGLPIQNLYGGREFGALAVQPVGSPHLVVLTPGVLLEVVDDDGRPVPEGSPGKLLVTKVRGRGTPFVRYEIGDQAVAGRPDLRRGVGVATLLSVAGRTSDLLRFRGMEISNIYWNHLLKDYPEVVRFQVAAFGDERLEIRYVGEPFSEEREARLLGIVEAFLHTDAVALVRRDELDHTTSGKLRQVVREAPAAG